mmetsp:Transcript_15642/g.27008  ORF Transcript_15642/g.27008 Transcript_15642/m.27008 type:complete len:586 (+) Transcript_15642:119-1876(+)
MASPDEILTNLAARFPSFDLDVLNVVLESCNYKEEIAAEYLETMETDVEPRPAVSNPSSNFLDQILDQQSSKQASMKEQPSSSNRSEFLEERYQAYKEICGFESDDEEQAHETQAAEEENEDQMIRRQYMKKGWKDAPGDEEDDDGDEEVEGLVFDWSLNSEYKHRYQPQADSNIRKDVHNQIKETLRRQDANVRRGKDFGAAEKVLDPATRMVIFRMENAGRVKTMNGVVQTGKEAHVYHGVDGAGRDIAIKVFKTAALEFVNRGDYIEGDHRFAHGYHKHNPRRMVRVWAEKEMRNLIRLTRAGIRCPRPVELREHVLVMSFIGKDGWPAPRLKEVKFASEQEMESAYIQSVAILRDLYQKAKLVHADFSAYNLLYYRGDVYVIDLAQGVQLDHPTAMEFLLKDVTNLTEYFLRSGYDRAMSVEELMDHVVAEPEKPEEWEEATEEDILHDQADQAAVLQFSEDGRVVALRDDADKIPPASDSDVTRAPSGAQPAGSGGSESDADEDPLDDVTGHAQGTTDVRGKKITTKAVKKAIKSQKKEARQSKKAARYARSRDDHPAPPHAQAHHLPQSPPPAVASASG